MSKQSASYPEFLGDEEFYRDADGYQPDLCDDDYWYGLYCEEQFELMLDSLGTSDEPQREDYADVCWLATDEDRAEFEQWAAGQGWIERAAA